MEITLNWHQDSHRFTGEDPDGNKIEIDGFRENGPSPMQLLLFALGSCTGIDMVVILEKMKQEITGLQIEVKGERQEKEQAKVWKEMEVVFHIKGKVDPKKAERAMNLSLEKYCSVGLTLANVKISGQVIIT